MHRYKQRIETFPYYELRFKGKRTRSKGKYLRPARKTLLIFLVFLPMIFYECFSKVLAYIIIKVR